MTDDNHEWLTPENLRKQEISERAKVDAGDLEVGHCGGYYAYRTGLDKTLIESHAIVDDDYALDYANNVSVLLEILGKKLAGNVLDAGCGIGFITNAFARINLDGQTFGLDLSSDAIVAACERYPDCVFTAQSADELDNYADGFFDVIHSREFYPFTRVDDENLHCQFLEAFAAKLKPGGVVILQMIIEPNGLCNTFESMKKRLYGFGYDRVERKVMVPLSLFRRAGSLPYMRPIYWGVTLAGNVLESIRPGRVGYLYYFRKTLKA